MICLSLQPKHDHLPAKKSCNKRWSETRRPEERKLGFEEIAIAQAHLVEVEDQIKAAYLRWEALESIEKN